MNSSQLGQLCLQGFLDGEEAGRVLLASNGQRTRLLLNTLQQAGRTVSITSKEFSGSNVNSTEVKETLLWSKRQKGKRKGDFAILSLCDFKHGDFTQCNQKLRSFAELLDKGMNHFNQLAFEVNVRDMQAEPADSNTVNLRPSGRGNGDKVIHLGMIVETTKVVEMFRHVGKEE